MCNRGECDRMDWEVMEYKLSHLLEKERWTIVAVVIQVADLSDIFTAQVHPYPILQVMDPSI